MEQNGVNDRRGLRLAIVLQTPKDEQSAVYMGYLLLAKALVGHGHSLEIVAPGDFPLLRRVAGRWVPLLYPFAVADWLRARRGTLDLVMFQSYAGWLASGLRRAPVPPAIVMFHGLEPLYYRELREEAANEGNPLSRRYRLLQELLMPLMLRVACRSAQGVVCTNRAEADYLSARGWAPAPGPRILPHGVGTEFFAPPRAFESIRTLLFVGQWLPMKGVRYLRESARTLLSDDPAMRLICAGTLTAADDVLGEFDHALRDRITVLPRVDHTTLARLYREADTFVFPSLYEGFGRALLEAMAGGLPIVTTGVGVAADALHDEESALIIHKRSAAAIVSAVRRLQTEPRLATRIGAGAAAAASHYRASEVVNDEVRFFLDRIQAAR
jgi:glycosyltransferase involved in cell wall biosynthesis